MRCRVPSRHRPRVSDDTRALRIVRPAAPPNVLAFRHGVILADGDPLALEPATPNQTTRPGPPSHRTTVVGDVPASANGPRIARPIPHTDKPNLGRDRAGLCEATDQVPSRVSTSST